MTRFAIAFAIATLFLLPAADAKPRFHAKKARPIDVPTFYDRESNNIATVEFVQEYSAAGSRRQVRGFTDGAVISKDGLVLISGRVRFPQQGSGRLSGGTLPNFPAFDSSSPTVGSFPRRSSHSTTTSTSGSSGSPTPPPPADTRTSGSAPATHPTSGTAFVPLRSTVATTAASRSSPPSE